MRWPTKSATSTAVFESPDALRSVLAALPRSPDHMFWFEYNFLYVLAGDGSPRRLGDHGPQGYAQRARFYAISDEARLSYARGVASYILFLAEATGLADARAGGQGAGAARGRGGLRRVRAGPRFLNRPIERRGDS